MDINVKEINEEIQKINKELKYLNTKLLAIKRLLKDIEESS